MDLREVETILGLVKWGTLANPKKSLNLKCDSPTLIIFFVGWECWSLGLLKTFLSHHAVCWQENGSEFRFIGEKRLDLRCCKAWFK